MNNQTDDSPRPKVFDVYIGNGFKSSKMEMERSVKLGRV